MCRECTGQLVLLVNESLARKGQTKTQTNQNPQNTNKKPAKNQPKTARPKETMAKCLKVSNCEGAKVLPTWVSVKC